MLASVGPPVTFSSVMSFSCRVNDSSNVCFEIATPPPKGEPPFGSSKIPSTRSASVAPVGVCTDSGEPTVSALSSA